MAAAQLPPLEEDLPRANIRRLVRAQLQELQPPEDKREIQVQKDALLAFSEAAKVFIHYLTSTAHDIATEARRATISGEDVLKALDDLEFPEFVEPLRATLAAFKRDAQAKNRKKAEQVKKRKAAAAGLPAGSGAGGPGGAGGGAEGDEGEEEGDDDGEEEGGAVEEEGRDDPISPGGGLQFGGGGGGGGEEEEEEEEDDGGGGE